MNELIEYLKKIEADVEYEAKALDDETIPKGMREFYSMIKKVDLPYGRIYNKEEAKIKSQKMPFEPMWFVFGQDNYSSFWLCRKEPNSEKKQFTYWDHEAGIGIDEPVWTDVFSFLKRMEEIDKAFQEEYVDEFDEEWD